MTQALMDLGPRVDTKPTGKPGGSHSPADSGAAFADAVDQAVDEACGRPDTVGRKDSRAHGGRSDTTARSVARSATATAPTPVRRPSSGR